MTQEQYYKKFDKLKIAHQEGFNGLVELDQFCQNNGIKYSLFYGTLLGAARHGGFIPWDDDVDVIMDRENYELFLKIASNKYSNNYIVANERTFPKRGIFTTRIMFKHSKLQEKTKQNFEYPSGVWVDVFVLDNVPSNKFRRIWHKLWCYAWDTWTYRKAKHNYSKNIYKILHYILMLPSYFMPYKWQLKHFKKVSTKFNKKETGLVSSTNCRLGYVNPLKKEWLNEYTTIEFNNKKFMVFKEWKKMLYHQYGDWQKLPNKAHRKPLHYK